MKGKKKFWEDETGPAEFESEDDEKIPWIILKNCFVKIYNDKFIIWDKS